MLKFLSIKNYALIAHLDIEFNRGLSIITGETGAGKSILLGALSLILGQRADTSVLKDKEKKCVVEGHFLLDKTAFADFFESQNLDWEHELIIRREITPTAKTRAFVNDSPVNLSVLKDLGSRLVDIHSQHQNLVLNDPLFQLNVIDYFGGLMKQRTEYEKAYQEYLVAEKEYKLLKEGMQKQKEDLDYFQFQWNQLDKAKLEEFAENDLEAEMDALNHSEEIKAKLGNTNFLLYQDEANGLGILKQSYTLLQSMEDYYKPAKELSSRLKSVFIELQDIQREVEDRFDGIEYDAERIAYLNERIEVLFGLQKKHAVDSVEALIEMRDQLQEDIGNIEFGDEKLAKLEMTCTKQFEQVELLALGLRKKREEAFPAFEKAIAAFLQEMAMPNAQFKIYNIDLQKPGSYGKDGIQFRFAANKNQELQEIGKVASGGEISRLMLGIKSLVATSMALPSIVFDEIDQGVSGDIASKMGNTIKKLSREKQVLHITHLPQIATKGDHHYRVFKYDDELSSYTDIKKLDEEERIIEVAKMLSGEDLTEEALLNARSLLNYN